ncbi:MAG: arylsulfatase [Bacteroidota bacterium]
MMSKKSIITNFKHSALGVMVLLPLSCSSEVYKPTEKERPNILLIVADDLGYNELSCYGQKFFKTPNIDELAAQGLRFTNFYAGNTVCAPSRSSLITGLHPGHAIHRGNHGITNGKFDRVAIPDSVVTFAECLQDVGYKTAIIGKWHLEHPDDLSSFPVNHGFDYAFGNRLPSQSQRNYRKIHNTGDYPYYPDTTWENSRKYFIPENKNNATGLFIDDLYTKKAIDFISKNKNQPFFVSFNFKVPHAPMSYYSDSLYFSKNWPDVERKYAARITNKMDKSVGEIIDFLEKEGLLENTLVLFTSDNGPHVVGGHDVEFFYSNGDLRGHKGQLYEGGIRVPFIAYWKGVIEPNTVSNHIAAFWDIAPTIADIAGISDHPFTDGLSFYNELLGKEQKTQEYLYWEYYQGKWPDVAFDQIKAVRYGDYKAVYFFETDKMELYNLKTDIGETKDVSSYHPDVVNKIKSIMHKEHDDSPFYNF